MAVLLSTIDGGWYHWSGVRGSDGEGLQMALDAAQQVAPLREDIRNEAYGHLEALKAATNTLDVQTRP